MKNDYLDYLMHYGRKGMKWGQNIFGREMYSYRLTSTPGSKVKRVKNFRYESEGVDRSKRPKYIKSEERADYNAIVRNGKQDSYRQAWTKGNVTTYKHMPKAEVLKNAIVGKTIGPKYIKRDYDEDSTTLNVNGKEVEYKKAYTNTDGRTTYKRVSSIDSLKSKIKTAIENRNNGNKESEKEVNDSIKKTTNKGQDWWTQNIKVGKDKPKVSSAERVVGTTEKGIKNLVDLRNLRDSHSVNKKAMKEMASLTNDELRDIVTRAKERRALEDDYMKYVASGVSRGRERTTETLESLGSVLEVVGSVVTIASTVKSIGNIVNGKDDD